jgi:hypothetical protein
VAEFEIVVFRQIDGVNNRVASAIVKEDGTLLARLRSGRETSTIVMPLGAGESVWGVVERVAEMLSALEEIGG